MLFLSSHPSQIFDGAHAKAVPLFQSCFARHKRPPALMSSGNTMRIEYQHWSTKFPGYPFFKVHYSFTNEPTTWENKPIGKFCRWMGIFVNIHTTCSRKSGPQILRYMYIWCYITKCFKQSSLVYVSKWLIVFLSLPKKEE